MLHHVTGQGLYTPAVARRGHYEELRCVLAVIRHGDRTPKQKMKMKVTQAGALPASQLTRRQCVSNLQTLP